MILIIFFVLFNVFIIYFTNQKFYTKIQSSFIQKIIIFTSQKEIFERQKDKLLKLYKKKMNHPNVISTRQKIGTLIKKFMKFLDDHHNKILQMGFLIQQATRIFKQYKKALQMIFYFEGLGLIMRISQQHGIFVGFRGMIRKLFQYQSGNQIQPQIKYQELLVQGKYTSIRSQLLGAQLLSNIFYKLIYQKQATNKSSIQEMVQNFIMYQKDLNVKNFIPQILNVLTALNLVQKNQATQVITYVGPDLKCFDQNHRKISWKVLQVIRRQQIAFGKQPTQIRNQKKIQQHHIDSNLPIPSHVSYFPQLFYAVLKSQNFQKRISNTIFFIGRSQKKAFGSLNNQKTNKTYKVDLDLAHKSVSRQHAVITYNFEVGRWQIRCLSKKNLIKIDDQRYAWGDKNIWLRNKSQIHIGCQKMVFLQASLPKSNSLNQN